MAAQTQHEIRPNYFVFDGYVDLSYGGIRLQADHAEFDAASRTILASGNVVLDQEGIRVTGEHMEFHLDTELGTIKNASGYIPPQFFFKGTELHKIGEEKYRLVDALFTECGEIKPHWQLNALSATIRLEETLKLSDVVFKAKEIPLLYSPYLLYPIRHDRATGFLFPNFGPNSQKGFWTEASFFWAISGSMDSTQWIDHWTKRGWGAGSDFRFTRTEDSNIYLKYFFADDQLFGNEWDMNSKIKESLPFDFGLTANVDLFSSFEYMQDTEKSSSLRATRQKQAQLSLSRNWSYYSFNTLFDWNSSQLNTNRFAGDSHFPEFEFRSRSQQVGSTPIYWSLLSSFSMIGKNDTSSVVPEYSYNRLDFFPTVSLPITGLSWLTATPSASYRITHYTQQIQSSIAAIDDPLVRNYSEVKMDLRGPNISRIFDTPGFSYSEKWKHAIEPLVSLQWRQDIPEYSQILKSDSDVDEIRGNQSITYSLTNLVYAKRFADQREDYDADQYQYYKPVFEVEQNKTAWEFISWKVSQSYDLKAENTEERFSPITSDLKISPAVNNSFQFTVKYDIYQKLFSEMRLSSTLRETKQWYANLGYVFQQTIAAVKTHQVRSSGGFNLFKKRWGLNGALDYDFVNRKPLDAAFSIAYNDDCFSIGMEWKRYFATGEQQFTFGISLLNIGNVISFRQDSDENAL